MKTEPIDLRVLEPEVLLSPKLEPIESVISDEEKRKQTLADALYHAMKLLEEEGAIAGKVSDIISSASEEMGVEICRRVKDVIDSYEAARFVVKVEKVGDVEADFEAAAQSPGSELEKNSDDNYEGEEAARVHDDIPWDMKVKAVTLATLYPNWSLETIRKKTTSLLRSHEQLLLWKQAVKKSNVSENYSVIGNLTFSRFAKACARGQPVTTRLLKSWAIHASKQFLSNSFKFKASDTWLRRFQIKHNIRETRTGYLTMKNHPPLSPEVILP